MADVFPREGRFMLVMGVCGVGKTSVACGVASRLGAAFVEGDDYHTAENKRRMAAGQPLTDELRLPWLSAIAEAALEAAASGKPVVIACSALKRRYRDFLRERLGGLRIIHLAGDRKLIAQRMTSRSGHFMPPTMLESQLGELEEPAPEEATRVDIAASPAELIDTITGIFRRHHGDDGAAPTKSAI